MTAWLIAANTKIYDVFGAFEQNETYWPMNAKIEIGDSIYIYLVVPHKQIGFVCGVLGTGYDLADIFDYVAPFIKGGAGKRPDGKPFMKLGATRTLALALESDSALSLPRLRETG